MRLMMLSLPNLCFVIFGSLTEFLLIDFGSTNATVREDPLNRSITLLMIWTTALQGPNRLDSLALSHSRGLTRDSLGL